MPAALTRADLDRLPISFATPSLGMTAGHTLESKLDVLQATGYKNVTLGWGNFLEWVRLKEPNLPASTAPAEWAHDGEADPADDAIWAAFYKYAGVIKAEVEARGMKIVVFQPISQYEGWAKGSAHQLWSRAKADKWLTLCARLGVEFLQLGSNDQPDTTGDWDSLCDDMRFIADLGQKHGVKVSYEPWCFSVRTPSWEGCWDVVRKVDHPFLGLCIDIAHVALSPDFGGMDPLTGADYPDFEGVLARIRAVPGDKIHFFEISDVIQPTAAAPLLKGSEYDAYHAADPDARALFTWSICGRCLPLVGKNAGDDVRGPEDLGGARAAEIFKAVLDTGFRGPCSFEVFEQQYMSLPDPTVTERYAKAGQLSKERLFEAILKL